MQLGCELMIILFIQAVDSGEVELFSKLFSFQFICSEVECLGFVVV